MTEPEAQKLVGVLVSTMPGQWSRMFAAISPKDVEEQQRATMAMYRRLLLDLEYPAANAAVERVLATSKFFPTPAEIREAAAAVVAGPVQAGGEQWGAVRKAMEREGAYRSPGVDFFFRDEVTARAVDAMGWRALCLSENTTADRARFIELYDKLAADARTEAIAGQLPAAQRLKELQARRQEQVGAGDAVAMVLRLAGGGL